MVIVSTVCSILCVIDHELIERLKINATSCSVLWDIPEALYMHAGISDRSLPWNCDGVCERGRFL